MVSFLANHFGDAEVAGRDRSAHPVGNIAGDSGRCLAIAAMQRVDVVRLQRRHRHDFEERRCFAASSAMIGQQPLAWDGRRSTLFTAAMAGRPDVADALEYEVVFGVQRIASTTEHRRGRPRPARSRRCGSSPVECATLAAMQAGGIDERDLRVRQMSHAENPMTRRLRPRRDDAELLPTSALSSVDLPTLGRPTSAAKPLRNLSRSGLGVTVCSSELPLGSADR